MFNKKLLGCIVVVILVLIIGLLVFQSGFLDRLSNERDDAQDFSQFEYPGINILLTTNVSDIIDCKVVPQLVSDFYGGNSIYVYYNLTNIVHNNKINFFETLNISNKLVIRSEVQYDDFDMTNSEGMCRFIDFDTVDPYSFEVGDYIINITIEDVLLDYTFSKSINFSIIDIMPKISVLEPASDIRSYQDYDIDAKFTLGDKIFIYQEYADIKSVGNSCDIYLELSIVDPDSVQMYFQSFNKSEVGNMAQSWWFTTNAEWQKGQYIVYAYLKDNTSELSISKYSSFILE